MKFIVDRKTWYRGQGSELSKLLRPDGMRCCIGFVGQQVGIEDKDLIGHAAVQSCGFEAEIHWPKWMQGGGPIFLSALKKAYSTNDDPQMSDDARELKLKGIFESQGDEIEFVG